MKERVSERTRPAEQGEGWQFHHDKHILNANQAAGKHFCNQACWMQAVISASKPRWTIGGSIILRLQGAVVVQMCNSGQPISAALLLSPYQSPASGKPTRPILALQ